MALTTSQTIDLFRALEVPYNGKVWKPEGQFNLDYTEFGPAADEVNLQIKIQNRLAELTEDEENWLVQKINQWQLIGINVASIDGSVGGVNGVQYNPEVARSNIRADIKTLIPVYRYRQEISIYEEQRKQGAGFWSPAPR